MKNLTRKLLMSIIATAFALAAFGTSTYAWFSLNKIAKVEGMELQVITESDMLIGKLSEVATDNAIDVDSKNFKTALDLSAEEPVTITAASSVEGINFFKATGAINGAGENEGTYEAAVNPTDSTKTHYYKQYDFVIKYTNPSTVDQTVDVTQLDLKYNGTVDPSRAFRIAFITTSCTTTVTNGEVTSSVIDGTATSQGVYKHESAQYFEADKAIKSVDTKDTVAAISEHLFTCPAGKVTFIKVSVVLWLEGEDSTCRSDVFTNLTDKWSLTFKIARTGADGENKVSSLNLLTNN